MPNKCYFLRTPFRTVPSVIAHSGFSCKQILPSPEPVGDEGADCMSAGQTRQQDRTMVYSECKVYTKNPHRREAMAPECPHSSLPHLPRRNPWLTMKYFAKGLQVFQWKAGAVQVPAWAYLGFVFVQLFWWMAERGAVCTGTDWFPRGETC